MVLPHEIQKLGFHLLDVTAADLNEHLRVEKLCLKKYVDEFKHFFGDSNDELVISEFSNKLNLSFFGKLLFENEIIGFLNYDIKADKLMTFQSP